MTKRAYFTILDAAGDRSVTSIGLEDGFDEADYDDALYQLAELIDDVIDGRITSVMWKEDDVDLSGLTSNTANPQSDVEELGVFILSGTGPRRSVFTAPTLNENNVIANTHQIDLTLGSVAALEAMLTGGLVLTSGNTVQPTDGQGNDITNVDEAIESFRSRS